jgi:hypothetical protein
MSKRKLITIKQYVHNQQEKGQTTNVFVDGLAFFA